MNSTTVLLPEIGPVIFEKSHRAKHINITIKPDRGIRVAVPMRISFKQAEQLVHTKIPWIKTHRQKLLQAEQASLQYSCKKINAIAAKSMLIQQLYKLAERYGFSVNNVSIRNQKTRWGSCSTLNNINLNIKLAALPEELIHYVLCHELVHTKVKNHGPLFWKELDNYVPEAKKVNKKLKLFKPGLIEFI
jgi:predicted metal-dependent hydrolase